MRQNRLIILCIWKNCITRISREWSRLPPSSSDGAAVLFLPLLITSFDYLFVFLMPTALAHEHTWGWAVSDERGAVCDLRQSSMRAYCAIYAKLPIIPLVPLHRFTCRLLARWPSEWVWVSASFCCFVVSWFFSFTAINACVFSTQHSQSTQQPSHQFDNH